MQYSSALLETLIAELTRLPGLGRKSAQRIAPLHLLRSPETDSQRLASAITELKANVHDCSVAGNVTETDPVPSADQRRDSTIICVVEQPMDVLALERTGEFRPLPCS
jgi:recombination protein RecR